MKKEIKNFYSIRTLHRKRTWSYQVEKAMIMPKDYFEQRDRYWRKQGDIHLHTNRCFEITGFQKMHIDYFSPTKIISHDRGKEIILMVTSGIVCEKCYNYYNDYENDYEAMKVDQDIIDECEQLKTRDDLAKYIRKIRKVGIRYKKHICYDCIAWEKKAIREAEIKERLRLFDEQIEKEKQSRIKETEQLQTKYEKPDYKKSYLYLMKCNRTGYYKIGRSKNPAHRERTLQAETPTIQMVASFKDKDFYEKAWHIHFEKERLRGEWFNLTRAQVAYFCHLMRKSDEEIDKVLMQPA